MNTNDPYKLTEKYKFEWTHQSMKQIQKRECNRSRCSFLTQVWDIENEDCLHWESSWNREFCEFPQFSLLSAFIKQAIVVYDLEESNFVEENLAPFPIFNWGCFPL